MQEVITGLLWLVYHLLVYDSLYNTVHDDTRMQVAAIMHTTERYIDFKVHKIQFQKGTSDCGLFSVAYATDLAFGNDPASYMYKQNLLRSHFTSCISNNALTPFPSEPIKYQRPKLIRNPVLCTCRLPDNGQKRKWCSVMIAKIGSISPL